MTSSWSERIRRWFRREPTFSGSFDSQAFERLCLDNPEAARQVLRRDHQELANELERTVAAYRARFAAFAARLDQLSPAALDQELRTLREAQDALRKMFHRIDVSEREAHELEAELHEWEMRAGEAGERHADHPDVRAEIIRSELATRGRMPRLIAIHPDRSPFRSLKTVPVAIDSGEASVDVPFEIEESSIDPDHLLDTIRAMTREVERWHSAPAMDGEAVEQARHLKELHAALKRLDRERGITRDRMAVAVRMRPMHD